MLEFVCACTSKLLFDLYHFVQTKLNMWKQQLLIARKQTRKQTMASEAKTI